MLSHVDVTVSGPVFDGRAEAAADAFMVRAQEAVAEQGVNMVRAELAGVLQNPTGFYESQIRTDTVREDVAVTDGGVVYGPWLAGVSSRNETTRFKGYAHWRRATQRLDGQAASIASAQLPPFVDRMNR